MQDELKNTVGGYFFFTEFLHIYPTEQPSLPQFYKLGWVWAASQGALAGRINVQQQVPAAGCHPDHRPALFTLTLSGI